MWWAGLVAKRCSKGSRDREDRRRVFVEMDRKGEKIYQDLLEAEMGMIITNRRYCLEFWVRRWPR